MALVFPYLVGNKIWSFLLFDLFSYLYLHCQWLLQGLWITAQISPSSQISPSALTASGSYVPIFSKLQHRQLASSPHISALGILPIPFPQLPPTSTTEAWDSELSSHLIQPTLHGNSVCSSSLEVSRPCNSAPPPTSYPTDLSGLHCPLSWTPCALPSQISF